MRDLHRSTREQAGEATRAPRHAHVPASAPPPMAAMLLQMQRSVGNAAVAAGPTRGTRPGRSLARGRVTAVEGFDYARSSPKVIKTYDVDTEKWADADLRGVPVKKDDGRRFPQATPGHIRQFDVFMAVGSVSSVEDIDKLDRALIEDINPQSIVPYRILHDVLHQSWHVAKELLLDPRAPNNNRRLMMTKLWEYRQWHHQEILAEVQEELNERMEDAKALMPSKGAGSSTLSSDIDVNLKGNHTELAVPLFNERFRNPRGLSAHKWDNEPGVVYDVNVYAIDFMHKYGAIVGPSGHKVTQKEGARPGREGGGIGDEDLLGADRFMQLVTSLFKARLFMDAVQWRNYEALTLRGLPAATRAGQERAFREAERRFAGYLAEMSAQIGVNLDRVADKAASGVEQLKAAAKVKAPSDRSIFNFWSGEDHAAAAKQENVLMTAANRIYEDKLAKIHSMRAELKTLIEKLKAAPEERHQAAIEKEIDLKLLILRELVAESAMYANEASMTDATIHHGVVGIQGGMEIDQQKSDIVNAVHEHLADVMKETARYGPELGPAAYKAGKYLMRLGDAGKNLGFGYIWGVQVLYALGREISEDIKVRADEGGVDTAHASAVAVKKHSGKVKLAELQSLAMETATQITQEYSQERRAHRSAGESDTNTAFGHRTVPKKAENTYVLNQDMEHPIERSDPRGERKLDMQPGNVGDFAFRLTEAELDQLRKEWAANRR